MFEPFLSLGILGYYYGSLALRIEHAFQSVLVSIPLEKQVANLLKPVVRSVVERSPISVVLRVEVSLVGQQKRNALQSAFLARQMQRSALLLVSSFDDSSVLQKDFYDLNMVVKCSEMKGRLFLVTEGLHVCATLQQSLN